MPTSRVLVGLFTPIGAMLLAASLSAAEPAKTYSVRGKVLDLNGKPIRGAVVAALSADEPLDPLFAKTVSDEKGAFRLAGLSGGKGAMVAASATGFACDGCGIRFTPETTEFEQNLVLGPPAPTSVVVRSPEGKPLAGAECFQFEGYGRNGSLTLNTRKMRILGVPFPLTDANGRAVLPLPTAFRLSADFRHPAYAPGRLKLHNTPLGRDLELKLPQGIPLSVRIQSTPPVDSVILTLLPADRDSPSTVHYRTVPLASSGELSLMVEPGRNLYLSVRRDDRIVFPRSHRDLDLTSSEFVQRTFTLRGLDATYEGRIEDRETGKPVAGIRVGAHAFDPVQSTLNTGLGPGWTSARQVVSNADGVFRLPCVSGKIRLFAVDHDPSAALQDQMLCVTPPRLLDGKPGVNKVAPFLMAKAKPVEGVVLGADGAPVRNAVVTEGGDFQWQAVLTDESGRFVFTPRLFKRLAPDTAECEASLRVLHPTKGDESRQTIRFGSSNNGSVFVTLKPAGEVKPKRKPRESDPGKPLIGKPAPELDAATVANFHGPLQLSKLRGRFVLLEFWGTWCGPCKRDMQKLKTSYQLYRDMGLEIVGVHTGDVPIPDVAEFVQKEKMPYPIVRDSASGETVRRYAVTGFPTYYLIDPEGIVVDAETASHGELYREMMSTIRSWLLSRRPPRPTR